MKKLIINTQTAPAAVGPYSQGVILDGWLFTNGQVGLDPVTGNMVAPDTATQADQALHNIEAILQAAGSSLDQVIRATAYLTNMDDFGIFNEVYARYFPEDFPARTCVEVSRLPLGALVEIDVIARVRTEADPASPMKGKK